jgi:CheY-like chemotaxis protein
MAKAKVRTAASRRGVRRDSPRKRRPPAPAPRIVEASLAALAHDMRVPLTGLLALGELLATSEIGERERGWALAIKNTAEHLTLLTTLIIDGVRADAAGLVLRRESFRLRELLDGVAVLLKARAETKGLVVDVTVADDIPELADGDSRRLRTVLENLIDNAVKFTEQGSVRLAIAAAAVSRRKFRLVVNVTDSGIGLKPAEMRRLFRPFGQASEEVARQYGGAGLGLAYAKRIAQAMGGELSLKSVAGQGSTFRLTALLERAEEPATGHAAEGGQGAAAPVRSLHTLCVEDNPYARVLLNTIVTELGHRPEFVGSGEAAVTSAGQGSYDLVLMDITLPGIDGHEAARRIRALPGRAGKVAIIGVSGRSDPGEEAKAQAAGMNAYVVKPIAPSALAAAIAQVQKGARRTGRQQPSLVR